MKFFENKLFCNEKQIQAYYATESLTKKMIIFFDCWIKDITDGTIPILINGITQTVVSKNTFSGKAEALEALKLLKAFMPERADLSIRPSSRGGFTVELRNPVEVYDIMMHTFLEHLKRTGALEKDDEIIRIKNVRFGFIPDKIDYQQKTLERGPRVHNYLVIMDMKNEYLSYEITYESFQQIAINEAQNKYFAIMQAMLVHQHSNLCGGAFYGVLQHLIPQNISVAPGKICELANISERLAEKYAKHYYVTDAETELNALDYGNYEDNYAMYESSLSSRT